MMRTFPILTEFRETETKAISQLNQNLMTSRNCIRCYFLFIYLFIQIYHMFTLFAHSTLHEKARNTLSELLQESNLILTNRNHSFLLLTS